MINARFKSWKELLTVVTTLGVVGSLIYVVTREDTNYLKYVTVVDDDAKVYKEGYVYFFFSADTNGEIQIGNIKGEMPRFTAFGGISMEEFNWPQLLTCNRFHGHLDEIEVQLTKDRTDYNKPENRSFIKLFLTDCDRSFFIAHRQL